MTLSNFKRDEVEGTAIDVKELYKTYGTRKAVNGIDLQVRKGEIFGILGPNGAGKTTTLEMIEGLRGADQHAETRIIVDGLNVRNARQRDELHQRIGLQLQASSLFEELTVKETLTMLARLYRRSVAVEDLIREFGLEAKSRARLDTLSSGQKQRLALAAALVNDPSIIFLDEPTTALDPQARRSTWEKIRELRQRGKTIILTTHYMDEAEQLCDRIAILFQGRIVTVGTPAQLISRFATEITITCRFATAPLPLEVVQHVRAVSRAVPVVEGFLISTHDMAHTLSDLLQQVERHHAVLKEITTHAPGLEDVYLSLTGSAIEYSAKQDEREA